MTKELRHFGLIALLAAFALPATAAAASETSAKQWEFDVLLDGKPIGSHTFEVTNDGPTDVLRTEASFDVKFLFITAFRYRHQNVETWNDGCLSSIDAETNSNGKELVVRGSSGDAGFAVQSSDGEAVLPSCVRTFAYWDPRVLEAEQLLNSQTGAYEDVSVTFESRDQIVVDDEPVDALRYRLSARAGDIKLWYSADTNVWLGLEAPAKGDRRIFYRAVSVPDSGPSAQTLARGS